MSPPEIHLCYTNCNRFGYNIYDAFIENSQVKVSIFGCLSRCKLECQDGSYAMVLSPLPKILTDKDPSELIKKIKENLFFE